MLAHVRESVGGEAGFMSLKHGREVWLYYIDLGVISIYLSLTLEHG